MSLSYSPMLKEHLPAVTDLLLDSFVDEPLVSGLGIARDVLEKEIYFQEFLEKTVKQNLSLVVVDAEGKVIGVNLVEKFRVEPTPDDVPINIKLYYDIFEDLGKQFNDKYGERTVYMMDSLAVNPEYRGKGVCQKLIEKGEELAKEKNFEYTMMYATNKTSHHFAQKNKYHEVGSQTYESFVHEGEAPLKSIAKEHLGVKIYCKNLQPENTRRELQED